MPRISVGSRVYVSSKESDGTVMFVGKTTFDYGPIWFGIELDNPCGTHNGTFENRTYFTCQNKFGIFTRASDIQLLKESEQQIAKLTLQLVNSHSSKSKKKLNLSPIAKTVESDSKHQVFVIFLQNKIYYSLFDDHNWIKL